MTSKAKILAVSFFIWLGKKRKRGKNMETKEKNVATPYDLDGKPPLKLAIPLGLQHVLAMFVGNLTPLLIITGVCGIESGSSIQVALLQNAMLVAGIVTLIQVYTIGPIGGKLPIVMGTSSGFIGVCRSVAITMESGVAGYGAILAACFIGGLFETVLGGFLKPLRKFFPAVVTGTVVLSIGLSLISVGIGSFGGGSSAADYGSLENLFVGTFVLVVIIALKHGTKGFTSFSSILIGIIVGYLVSIPFGMVDFSSIGEAGVCQLPSLMHFGVQFEPSSCVALGILFAINSIQAIGDYSATTIGAMDRTPKDDELQRGIVGYGLSNVVGALLGGLPTATYSQNVGIVTTTKVINRWVLGLAAAILGIAGLVPKFSAILTTIPQCVLGGATVSVFASIAMTGMKLVASAEMDYRNSSIVGLAAALGMGVSQATAALASFPTWVTTIFGKSPVVLATIIAVMLNVILPKTRDEQKEEAKKKIKIEQKLEEDHREFGE